MHELVCGAIYSRLSDVLKNSTIKVFYIKKKDRIEIKIKNQLFEREFIHGYAFATDLIMEGHSGFEIAEATLKSYRRWVLNNFFKN